MRRRITVTPTAPGEGMVSISLLTRRVLETAGVPVPEYVRLVRSGDLDPARCTTRFNSHAETVARCRAAGRDLPDLPFLSGEVTWRRKGRHWSIDVHQGVVAPGVTWNEAQPRGGPPVSLSVSGVVLPDSTLTELAGMPLRVAVDHPVFDDERLVIVEARCYPPSSFGGMSSPGTTAFRLDVPREELPDPEVRDGIQ